MPTVKVNTSDREWLGYRPVGDVVAYGTDIKGVMYFQTTVEVASVEHVKFAGAAMIRFDLGPNAPRDHNRYAMYPETYLVEDGSAHDVDCACAGHGVCEYWNTVPAGARAE
jgi:hypothetical protein